jgi:Cdc6-like AAA superfamily ATPase
MTTPNKTQIVEKAIELWKNDRSRANDPSFDLTPEIEELRENGYLSSARSNLMTSTETKNEQWINSVSETSDFTVDIQQLFDSGCLILGSKHTGKSDLAMLVSDRVMKKDAVVVVFDPSLDWIARSSIKQYVKVEPYRTLDVPCESTIFDISLLSPNQQQRTVENFSEKLFQSQASNPERKRYLVIFEEAHTYFT